jgi:hypothetical protein
MTNNGNNNENPRQEKSRKLTRTFTMNISEDEFREFEKYAVKIGVTKSRIVRRLLQEKNIINSNN